MLQHIVNDLELMQFQWMASNRIIQPNGCSLIHDSSCTFEFFKKLMTVCKIGMKYYVLFHMVPLVMRLRKQKSAKDRLRVTGKTLYEYIRSVLFMGFLVALTKRGLCINDQNGGTFNGKLFAVGSLVSGASILWEQKGRQREIGYFIVAKALRSSYIMLKRTGYFSFPNEFMVMHVLAMAGLAYVYHHHPDMLKFKSTFELIWGKD